MPILLWMCRLFAVRKIFADVFESAHLMVGVFFYGVSSRRGAWNAGSLG